MRHINEVCKKSKKKNKTLCNSSSHHTKSSQFSRFRSLSLWQQSRN